MDGSSAQIYTFIGALKNKSDNHQGSLHRVLARFDRIVEYMVYLYSIGSVRIHLLSSGILRGNRYTQPYCPDLPTIPPKNPAAARPPKPFPAVRSHAYRRHISAAGHKDNARDRMVSAA